MMYKIYERVNVEIASPSFDPISFPFNFVDSRGITYALNLS